MKKLKKMLKFEEEDKKKKYEDISKLHKIISIEKHKCEIRNLKRKEFYSYE
jgi:hypothetical protein